MPYIEAKDRPLYLNALKEMPIINTKGDLEFCITWLQNYYMLYKTWEYGTLHDCVYATQHCSDEFRRRHLDPYEDKARLKDGDVE